MSYFLLKIIICIDLTPRSTEVFILEVADITASTLQLIGLLGSLGCQYLACRPFVPNHIYGCKKEKGRGA